MSNKKDNLIQFPTNKIKSKWKPWSPKDLNVIDISEIDPDLKKEVEVSFDQLSNDIDTCDTSFNKIFEYSKYIQKMSHYMVTELDTDNLTWLEAELREIFLKLSEKKVDFD